MKNYWGRQFARMQRGRLWIGIIQFALITSMAFDLSWWLTLIAAPGACLLMWALGYADSKWGTWRGQIGYQATLNPVLQEILLEVKKRD